MRHRLIITGLLAGLAAVAATAQLKLRDDAVEFPDGTVQMTAAKNPESPLEYVQGSVEIELLPGEYCKSGDIPTTFFRRLRIDWLSVSIETDTVAEVPVDFDLVTHLSGTTTVFGVARVVNPVSVGGSSQLLARSSSQVTIYHSPSSVSHVLRVYVCRATDTNSTTARLSFHGAEFGL